MDKANPRRRSGSSASQSSEDVLNVQDDEGWEDAHPEDSEEKVEVQCLFDDTKLESVTALLQHCQHAHGYDLIHVRKDLGLDFYGTVKLINYIRAEVLAGDLHAQRALAPPSSRDVFDDDKYLQPVLEDDALLFSIDEIGGEMGAEDPNDAGPGAATSRVLELEEELQRLQRQFGEYRTAVKKTLDERLEEQSSTLPSSTSPAPKASEKGDDDSHYFTSYAYNEIHEIMLKDHVRTDAYRDFIYDNKNVFRDKIVLDVGCGTGILSMFCAKAGAKKVIAVDNSDIIDKARENVFENGLDGVITCLRGKIEDVTLPVPKVDIIVSEWMGYCLLYEAMLDSVLWARDHYLAPDGLMVPSHTTIYLAPYSDPDYVASHVSFWHSVYGFSMKAMQASIHDDVIIRDVPAATTASSAPATVLEMPLHSIRTADLTFLRDFAISLDREIDALDGWVIWFDVFFATSRDEGRMAPMKPGRGGVSFTTGPHGPATHWRQGVLLVKEEKKEDLKSEEKEEEKEKEEKEKEEKEKEEKEKEETEKEEKEKEEKEQEEKEKEEEEKEEKEDAGLKKSQTITGQISYRKRAENSRELEITLSWEIGPPPPLSSSPSSPSAVAENTDTGLVGLSTGLEGGRRAKKQTKEKKHEQTWFMR